MKKGKNTKKKICLISSSGGHYEQLRMLSPLANKHDIFWVTERTRYPSKADYYLLQTGSMDVFFMFKMIINFVKSLLIWYKERPDLVVTTGAMVVIPMVIVAKIFKKRIIYIESFARVYDASRTGRLMYKYSDLFIVQWESLKTVYPNAIYGGSIY